MTTKAEPKAANPSADDLRIASLVRMLSAAADREMGLTMEVLAGQAEIARLRAELHETRTPAPAPDHQEPASDLAVAA